jgi:hypothetical protein
MPNQEKKPSQDETPQTSEQKPATEKKKLTLDVTDVSEILERKISP